MRFFRVSEQRFVRHIRNEKQTDHFANVDRYDSLLFDARYQSFEIVVRLQHQRNKRIVTKTRVDYTC